MLPRDKDDCLGKTNRKNRNNNNNDANMTGIRYNELKGIDI